MIHAIKKLAEALKEKVKVKGRFDEKLATQRRCN
jgi:hypothetical protein